MNDKIFIGKSIIFLLLVGAGLEWVDKRVNYVFSLIYSQIILSALLGIYDLYLKLDKNIERTFELITEKPGVIIYEGIY